jgi:hypothetical protein
MPIRYQRFWRNGPVPYFLSIIRPKKPAIRKKRGIRKLCSQSPSHLEAPVGNPPPMNIRKIIV